MSEAVSVVEDERWAVMQCDGAPRLVEERGRLRVGRARDPINEARMNVHRGVCRRYRKDVTQAERREIESGPPPAV